MVSHFYRFSDEEIEKMIEELSPVQKEIFEEEVMSGKTRRHSLFIAKSFCAKCGRERT
jgi:hypothetical protein